MKVPIERFLFRAGAAGRRDHQFLRSRPGPGWPASAVAGRHPGDPRAVVDLPGCAHHVPALIPPGRGGPVADGLRVRVLCVGALLSGPHYRRPGGQHWLSQLVSRPERSGHEAGEEGAFGAHIGANERCGCAGLGGRHGNGHSVVRTTGPASLLPLQRCGPGSRRGHRAAPSDRHRGWPC